MIIYQCSVCGHPNGPLTLPACCCECFEELRLEDDIDKLKKDNENK